MTSKFDKNYKFIKPKLYIEKYKEIYPKTYCNYSIKNNDQEKSV